MYDEKADMWALGVIFFELFSPFNSAMERVHVLSDLRRTHAVPADFMQWTEALAAEKRSQSERRSEREREREREKDKERREERRLEREKVASIVHQLIAADPAQRPSAAALLKSGLIPIKIEDEYLELSLKLLSSRDSPHHSALLSMLFSQAVDPLTDYTFDYLSREASALHVIKEGSTSAAVPLPLSSFHLFQQRVFDVAVHHFRLHGATLFNTPLLHPKTAHALLEEQHNQVLLLDESGLLLKLPYTLTIPFARYVAQTAALDEDTRSTSLIDSSAWSRNGLRVGGASLLSMDWRRFDVARVFRKNPVGGRPRDLYEGDWDVVWPNPCGVSASFLAASSASSPMEGRREVEGYHREKRLSIVAEAIKLTLDVVSHFSYALGPVLIRLNHHSLVDAVLQSVLPPSSSPTHTELVAQLYRLSSHFSQLASPFARSAFRKQLLKTSLTERQVDWLGSCLTLRADHTQVDLAVSRVRELLQSAPPSATPLPSQKSRDAWGAKVEEALGEVRSLYDLLKAIGVAEYVVFDLGLTAKRELYGGALTFQAFMHANANAATSDSSARQASSPSSSAAPSSTLAFDPIAVGGCYDRLLAQLMHPNASSAMSGVGVNLAMEKILHAVIDCHLHTKELRTFPSFSAFFTSSSLLATTASAASRFKKGKRGSTVAAVPSSSLFSSPSSSPAPTSFLPPTLPSLASSLPSVLLYSPKHHLLRERVQLASLLWTEHFLCLYSTPLSLSLSLLYSFLRVQSVRFLVLMRRRQWRERGVVELIDMDGVANQRRWDRIVTRINGKEQGEKEGKAVGAAAARDDDEQREREKEREGIEEILISEIFAVLRSRAANMKRGEDSDGAAQPSYSGGLGAGGVTSSTSASSASTSHPSAHVHPHHHVHHPHGASSTALSSASSVSTSSSLHIQFIDPASTIKSSQKANLLTAARRSIQPLCTVAMEKVSVAVAVDAPIAQLRGMGTAYMVVGRGGEEGRGRGGGCVR